MSTENSDFQKFALAVGKYFSQSKECSYDKCKKLFLTLQSEIKELSCEDFRIFYFRAFYQSSIDLLEEAKINIDKSIKLLSSIKDVIDFNIENGKMLFRPYSNDAYVPVYEMNYNNSLVGNIYSLAGEIYAKIGEETESLNFYKKAQYHNSFVKSDFDNNNFVHVFSFRKYNQFTLADLVNNEITVSPSTCMNDPFDSLINLWADKDKLNQTCTELLHIKPFHDSFKFYRIRSFCIGGGNKPVKNILMWSHYADEHKGFCVKYRLSKHFIKQEENEGNQHMYMKKITYKDLKFNLYSKSINSNIAFATKKKDWKYENEARLIVYNIEEKDSHYGIHLDNDSKIEAIYFGYLCPKSTIKTIQNIFKMQGIKLPKFYIMVLNPKDVYNLQIEKCPIEI